MSQEAIVEERNKFSDLQQQLYQLRALQGMYERTKRREELTLQELADLAENDPSHATFKAVGKAYLRAPISQIRTELDESIRKCDDELSKLPAQREILENKANQVQAHLRELISETQKH